MYTAHWHPFLLCGKQDWVEVTQHPFMSLVRKRIMWLLVVVFSFTLDANH